MKGTSDSKKGGKKNRKLGRSANEPKHLRYNNKHNYIAGSHKKATHHKTPLERYLASKVKEK